uniref:Inactive LRR receptor-like serine/threonine-protein kinase BIR2 n=1 Tax=Vitis vinifera TaxID=29760 RepID=A5B2H0_VITVI|nr:hypothetical protein VITISV_038911 [Vitis vinifera]
MGVWGVVLVCLLICARVPSSWSDPDDEACLTHLSESLEDPTKAPPATMGESISSRSPTSLSEAPSLPTFPTAPISNPSDLSSNSLTGPIPSDLQSLVNLAVLNLSSNHLDGEIPPQLAFCAYLNVIDLHDNSLSGPIPQQFGLLVRLSAFDVSNNRLSGPIPPNLGNRSGNFPRFNASSFEGNKDLYGYPLAPLKSRGLSILAIVGIGLGSGFVSLVLSFTAVCIWLRVTEEKMASEEGKISQLMPDY